jgi:WD40 repeat protein
MKYVAVVIVVCAGGANCLADSLPAVAPTQARLVQTITGLDGPAFALAYDKSRGILAVGCESGAIQLWDKDVWMGVRSGGHTPAVLRAHTGPVTALAWSGTTLLSGGADGKIVFISMPGGKTVRTIAANGIVRALAVSPDGKRLAWAAEDPAFNLVDIASGNGVTRLAGHHDWVTALAFNARGDRLASGSLDGSVRVWDPTTAKPLLTITAKAATPPPKAPPAPQNAVSAMAFSPDGKLLAVGGSDTQVHLFNVADGKAVRSMPGHTGPITALAFYPGGSVLASGSKDRTARLWEPASGRAIKTLDGHASWVEAIAFVARGTRLASAGADQTVHVWDLTAPAKK